MQPGDADDRRDDADEGAPDEKPRIPPPHPGDPGWRGTVLVEEHLAWLELLETPDDDEDAGGTGAHGGPHPTGDGPPTRTT